MRISTRRETGALFLGDIAILYLSLWVTLFVRYGDAPSEMLWRQHVVPFSLLFLVWLVVFFITGLYEKHTLVLKSKIPSLILNAQTVNVVIALLFFYLIPYFSVAPKTNLIIYLFVSLVLLFFWRRRAASLLGVRSVQNALLIGSGTEMHELFKEVNNNNRYNLRFTSSIDLEEIGGIDFHKEVLNRVYAEDISIIVIDIRHHTVEEILPHLYNLIFAGVHFIDLYKVYEEVFDRIPLSLVKYNWFLEHLSLSPKVVYDSFKRVMDIFGALIVGLPSLILFPFIALAIFFESPGKIFYIQERLGENNRLIKIPKFRTMERCDTGDEAVTSTNRITRVGVFLRKTRLDEVPQLWSVLKGDLSLIGPRPEIPQLAQIYEDEVPYYNVRHLIKPGLSGWAQLYHDDHPHHGINSQETQIKLSYDLYYLKNRSPLLDLKIALKTVKKIITRSGK